MPRRSNYRRAAAGGEQRTGVEVTLLGTSLPERGRTSWRSGRSAALDVTTYAYDASKRLTSVSYVDGTQIRYSYNAAGSIVSRVVGKVTDVVNTLDVEASAPGTKCDALTDGLLVVRYLSGLTGPSLTKGALGTTATRTDTVAIKGFLDGRDAICRAIRSVWLEDSTPMATWARIRCHSWIRVALRIFAPPKTMQGATKTTTCACSRATIALIPRPRKPMRSRREMCATCRAEN